MVNSIKGSIRIVILPLICLGSIAAGILVSGCEKSNGPEPSLCSHAYDSLVLIVNTEQGPAPIAPAIPLDSIKRMIVSETGLQTIADFPGFSQDLPIEGIGKIVFK
jgi:hypothetical protein